MHSCSKRHLLRNRAPRDHAAYLYPDSGSLCDAMSEYVEGAVERGEAAVVIATEEHGDGLMRRLERSGRDCRALLASGQLVRLDAASMLDRVMRGREPDHGTFEEIVHGVLGAVRSRFPALSAYGELVDLLCRQGNPEAAERLEEWWNGLIDEQGFSLLCGYRSDAVGAGAAGVCRTHTHLITDEEDGRFDRAVLAAMREVFDDAEAMRDFLTERYRGSAALPSAHAVLLSLQEMLPWVAERVRLRAKVIYSG